MGTDTDQDLGQRIDTVRVGCGLTVLDLAGETRIPLTTLQRRLGGDGRLTVAELGRISKALHVSPASWFEEAA